MRWILALLLMTAALAGCTGAESDDPAPAFDGGTDESKDVHVDGEGHEEQPTTGAQGASGSQENETAPNTPPTASLSSGVRNATVPFELMLELDGADPDGDNLTWSLTLGADVLAEGDDLPSSHNWTAEEPGSYTFNLTVSDGFNQTVANFTFTGLEPEMVGTASQVVEGNIDGYSPACIDASLYASGLDGYVEVPVDPATIGLSYTFSFQSASVFDAFLILDAAGDALVYEVVGLHMPFDWSGSGTVPPGAATLVFAACDNSLAPANGVGEGFSYAAE